MRTREEINTALNTFEQRIHPDLLPTLDGPKLAAMKSAGYEKLQLEVLLDIRELLQEIPVCGHGLRGWCAACAYRIQSGEFPG